MEPTHILAPGTPRSNDSLDESSEIIVFSPRDDEPLTNPPTMSRPSIGVVVPETDEEDGDVSDDEDDCDDEGGRDGEQRQFAEFFGQKGSVEDVGEDVNASVDDESPELGPDSPVETKNARSSASALDDSSFIGRAKSKSARRRVLISSSSDDDDDADDERVEEDDADDKWNRRRGRGSRRTSGRDSDVPHTDANADAACIGGFDSGADEDAAEIEQERSPRRDHSIHLVESSEEVDTDVIEVESDDEVDDVVRRGDVLPMKAPAPARARAPPEPTRESLDDQTHELECIVAKIEEVKKLWERTGRKLPDNGEKLKQKLESLDARRILLEKSIAAAKKELRKKERGYEKEEDFLGSVGEDSVRASSSSLARELRDEMVPLGSRSSAGALAVGDDEYRDVRPTPLVGLFSSSRPATTVNPMSMFGKLAPPSKVLQHMYAADPDENKLFGGRMNEARHREVKTVTHDSLFGLHEAFKTMPKEDDDDLLEEPRRLKVPLMEHQRRAVTWALWRETQNPPGGILADDMGLGKTYTMIALAVKAAELKRAVGDSSDEDEKENDEWLESKALRKAGLKKSDGTLIICPASCIGQWENEVKSKVRGHLRVLQYHGASRKRTTPRSMADYDFVVTSYNTVACDFNPRGGGESDSPLLKVAWHRVILDEAHVIRNHKAQSSQAVCRLRAGRRWCLTGTPIHNKELDMYSLLKFMRMAPFDEYEVWKRFVDNGSQAGAKRLNLVVKAILLRRTKDQVDKKTGKALVTLPERKERTHELTLNEAERRVHDVVMSFSRDFLVKFLKQHDDHDGLERLGHADVGRDRDKPLLNLAKKDGDGKVKVTAILVLLLRLRQICCHPHLLWNILNDTEIEAEARGVTSADCSAVDQLMSGLERLSLTSNSDSESDPDSETRRFFNRSNPLFDEKTVSTKIAALMEALKEIPEEDKIVLVSQWTSMLDIIMLHLHRNKIKTCSLNGNVPVKDRTDIVSDFNSPKSSTKVLLLSLGAGGVGLNLVGGNHLFLVDVHWNPQLEAQACDRIYRVGQKKPVFIHRFICKGTIEERVRAIQTKKLVIAEGVLTGAKRVANQKLTIQDLIELFKD